MPALSPSMSEGTIVKWLKQEGTFKFLLISSGDHLNHDVDSNR